MWQHPFVNVFKHFRVGEWKKCSKQGEVLSVMDKSLKCTVYRVTGSIPSNNYVQIPKTKTQSLGLTGRYLYLLFKPIAGKYFVVHMDLATDEGLIIRISFSNLFKEFKSTSTWLQFPFVCPAGKGTVEDLTSKSSKKDLPGPAPPTSRWTLLLLDFQYILSMYLNRKFSYLKSIQLCSSLFVKNVFTSDIQYEPGITVQEARDLGLLTSGIQPLPREMSFPKPKGQEWEVLYNLLRFPNSASRVPFDSIQRSSPHAKKTRETSRKQAPGEISPQRTSIREVNVNKSGGSNSTSMDALTRSRKPKKSKPKVVKELPEVGLDSVGDISILQGSQGEVHVFADPDDNVTIHRRDKKSGVTKSSKVVPSSSSKKHGTYTSLLPDPILSLRKIVGFGGCTTKEALWDHTGSHLVYPCHAVIVTMNISNGHQRFFIGHTDKVSALSFNSSCTLLASAQTGAQSVVRVWSYQSGECLAMFRAEAHSLHCLSFSRSGAVLCGVGKDNHGKNLVIAWRTARVHKGGEVSVVAKAHTDVEIIRMKVTPFDESRMVSCGRDNIRIWRLRNGSLRSAPVNVGEFNSTEFTDICFEAVPLHGLQPADKMFYACSKSGHIFQIDFARVSVVHIRRLLPSGKHVQEKSTFGSGPGIAINSMAMSEAFCVTGSDDGFLRLWPLDFSSIFLEAEHEGPVTVVGITVDGLNMLAGTSTGNLGYLDVSTRNYTTVMRSHTGRVLCMSLDPVRRQMATVSEDHTIRLWDLDSLQQLFDFHSPVECPVSVCYHPTIQSFACGFDNGVVRIFSVQSTSLIAELKQHKGSITGLLFSPNGARLCSSSSSGTLALYDASDDRYPVMRLLGNMVARGEDKFGPDALSGSEDGRHVAFVGPSEFAVTVVDGKNLNEILRIDISSMAPDSDSHVVDSAIKVHFAPEKTKQLLVATANCNLLRFDAKSGRLLNKISGVHRSGITGVDVCHDCRHLATAGDRVVKIWDYHMRLDLNFQVSIGHSEVIQQVKFTPDSLGLISIGEGIFLWDFYGVNKDKETIRSGYKPLSKSDHSFQSPVRRSLEFSQSLQPRTNVPKPTTPTDMSDVSRVQPLDEMEDTPDRDEEVLVGPELESRSEISSIAEEDTAGTMETLGRSRQTRSHQRPPSGLEDRHPSPPEKLDEAGGDDEDESENRKQKKPSCLKHFIPKQNNSQMAQRRYTAPPNQAGLRLKSVLGFNGNGRGNVIWHPETGLFVYTSGCIVVIEDLNDNSQRHLLGHVEEISFLTLQHDGQLLASASGSRGLTGSQICLWDVSSGISTKVLSYHEHQIVCLAYSRDDRFLISVGDYRDCSLVVWDTHDYTILTVSRAALPIHELAWDPHSPNEFATVGEGGTVLFWLLDETHEKFSLNIHEADVPQDLMDTKNMILGDVAFTCVQYGGDSVLYVGTNTGVLSAWDTRQNSCFMHWDADSAEIDVIVCRFGSSRLITGGASRLLRLWSVYGVGEMRLLPGTHQRVDGQGLVMEDEMTLDGAITAAEFDDILDVGVVATSEGTLWYIDWVNRTSVRLVGSHSNKINDLAFSQNDFFATSCDDGSLRIFSLEEMEPTVQFQVLDQSCTCLAFSPPASKGSLSPFTINGVVAGYSDGTVRLFDLSKVEMVLKMQPQAVAITKITFSADGHVIISGSADGIIAISSPTTGITMRVIGEHKGAPITDLHVSQDAEHVPGLHSPHLWLAASADRRVSVWSSDWPKDFCEMVDWLTFPAPAFAPDGTALKKKDLAHFQLLPSSLARFSPSDSDIIIYAGYGMQKAVNFYSISQKKVVRRGALTHWATALDVNSLGHLYAIGTKERLVKLMDYSEGSFQDFVGHYSGIQLVKFTPTGKHLLTVSQNEILVWEVTI
ncbi:WD repeat-containing protein 90-like isoform X2 [Apostichopus japonicus]